MTTDRKNTASILQTIFRKNIKGDRDYDKI